MAYECRTKVERPIRGVAPLPDSQEETFRRQIDAGDSLLKEQQAEIHALRQARKSLDSGADAVNGLLERMIASQAQQISHLAVEIARKILRSRVENSDYAIEAVIQQALSKAPARHNVTVRLHPDDLAKCKEAREEDGHGSIGALELIADASVGRAECIIETPKGSIESVIEEHLIKVEEALRSSWQPN